MDESNIQVYRISLKVVIEWEKWKIKKGGFSNVTTAEMIGIVVLGLSSLIGIFTAVYRPLNENTKAMTELTLKVEQLAKEIKDQNDKLEKQNREIEEYKEHVKKGQREQWEVLDRHELEIVKVKNDLKLCKIQNGNGGKNDV
jgi:peptidoglycan hydrolase CwlO-like protein